MPHFIPVLAVAIAALVVLYLGFAYADFSGKSGTAFSVLKAPAKAVKASEPNSIFIDENFDVNAEATKLSFFSSSASNGPLFREDSEIAEFDSEEEFNRAFIELRVKKTNNLGPISFILNDAEIFRGGLKVGKYQFDFDPTLLKTTNTLKAEAGSSGIHFWAPTTYNFDLFIYGVNEERFSKKFFVKDTKFSKFEIGFKEREGSLSIRLNGKEIFGGEPEEVLDIDVSKFVKSGDNELEIVADPGSQFSVDYVQLMKKGFG